MGEQGPRGVVGLVGIRQKLALAFIIVGGFGLTVTIVGIAALAVRVQHQGAKIEVQQTEIKSLVGALAANVNAQVKNRTSNVLTWCGSINADRDYQRQRVIDATANNPTLRVLPYTLPDLPCKQLAATTAKSGEHHPNSAASKSKTPR